ncbi:MAG: DUF6318 family protein [Ornithinibacter sp.]
MEQRTIRMPAGWVRSRAAVVAGLAGLVVVTGVLSGCDSEAATPGGSSSSPSVTSASASPSASSASPSASAGPSVAIPAAARVKSDKGAEAFVRYFMDQAAQAWMLPDPRLIELHATKDCSACQDLAKAARDLDNAGQRYDGPPVSVRRLKVLRSSGTDVAFDAMLRENKVRIVSASGKVVASYPERPITRAIAVKWGDGRWLLDGIGE